MGLAHSPRIVTDGLVLALDAGNTKSNSEISVRWNNTTADSTKISSVGVITCTAIHESSSSFFAQKYSSCEISGGTVWDERPPTISEMGEVLSGNLTCKSHQTGTYSQVQYLFGGFPNAGDCCTLRFTGFGVGAVIGVGGYFASTRQVQLTGDLRNSPVTITSPSGGFADPIVLTSDPADIKFTSVNAGGSDPWYVYWLGPYNQVPYNIRSNPGYVTGATYSSNDGGALVFDGTNDRISGISLPSISKVTVEWWGTSDYGDSNYAAPVMSTSSGAWTDGFGFYQKDGNVIWFVNHFNDNKVQSAATSFGFTHWVGTYDLNNIKLYRNGSLVGTTAYTTAINQSTTNLDIASQSTSYHWDGKISNVKVYNKALTATEVEQNYNATKGRYA